MKRIIVIAGICALTGCGTTSGVVPMGQNTYMVSHSDNSPAASLGAVRAAALKDAGAFCGSKAQDFQVLTSTDTPRAFGQFPESIVQFRCVAKSL